MSRFSLNGKVYLLSDLLGDKSPLKPRKKQQIIKAGKTRCSIVVNGRSVEIHGIRVTQSELENKKDDWTCW